MATTAKFYDSNWPRIYNQACNEDGLYAVKLEGGFWYRFRRMVPFGDSNGRYSPKYVELLDAYHTEFESSLGEPRNITIPVSAIRQMQEIRR